MPFRVSTEQIRQEATAMKYATVLNNMGGGTFRRKDVLNALLKEYPDYNIRSFNRHFSRFLSNGLIENVGRDLYIAVPGGTAKEAYSYRSPSKRFSGVLSFLDSEFGSADFLMYETIQLNEFFDHQTAQNIIVVSAEKMLTDAVFEKLRERFRPVMLSSGPYDIRRYTENDLVVVEKLSSRYPKSRTDKHSYSIEKLMVDIFAERTMRSLFSPGDYPSAVENMFRMYRVNETSMFNYAKMRHKDTKIRNMLRNETGVKLYTDGETR